MTQLSDRGMAMGARRIESVDVFRGLTVLVMIFVNDVSGVAGLPWWTYHMPPGADGMTYVDMVFPAFLFIVGMAMPLAIERRFEKGDSLIRVWKHVVTRSLSLIVLGIFLANCSKVDPALTGVSAGFWMVAGLVAAILFWNVYPRTGPKTIYKALRFGGLVALITVFAIFRRRLPDGHVAWLDFSYWEILGLIGRAYLASCILYIPLRNRRWAPFVLLGVLTALNVGSRFGWLGFMRAVPYWAWPFDAGEFPSMIMAGVATSAIMLEKRIASALGEKTLWAAGFAAVLWALGLLCRPLGLSKLDATPSWCLWCSATCVILFLALYWLCDVGRRTKWAWLVKAAGSNTLLTYLLPDISYGVFGGIYLGAVTRSGLPGALKSAGFTLAILVLAHLLTRLKVRMQI